MKIAASQKSAPLKTELKFDKTKKLDTITWFCKTDSPEERDEWVRNIKEHIDELNIPSHELLLKDEEEKELYDSRIEKEESSPE